MLDFKVLLAFCVLKQQAWIKFASSVSEMWDTAVFYQTFPRHQIGLDYFKTLAPV